MNDVSRLCMRLRSGSIGRLIPILQQGFAVSVPSGSNLLDVLCHAGFSRDYLERYVKTIFVDGSAVDDPASREIFTGSVIALSAAMPGLAGAIFRKGSPFSGLRSRTDRQENAEAVNQCKAVVTLKLFNTVAEDMGVSLLGRGIILNRSVLEGFFINRRELLETSLVEVKLDGKPMDRSLLFARGFCHSERIVLQAS